MTDFERPVHDPTTDTTAVDRVAPEDVSTDTLATPVATQPIGTNAGATGPAPRRSRTRWFAALGIIALIVGVTAIATLALTGSSPASTVVGYAPADSVAYGEVRLDLPGDQRQKIGAFLSKFPGFADQAALETKLGEVLDRLTSDATSGKQTYTKDIKPWFDGELAFSLGPIPVMSASDPMGSMAAARGLLLLSIKDEPLARAWFTNAFKEAGANGTNEDYAGTTLTVFSDPSMPAVKAAFALVDGKVAIAGDLTSVKAAIDTKGSGGLVKTAAYAAAQKSLTGDNVGFMFMDMRAVLDASMKMNAALASTPPMSAAMLDLLPDWGAFRLRFEADGIVMDSIVPHVATAPGPSENRANGVAAYAPPTTIVFSSGNDYGATLVESIAIYRQEPTFAEIFKSIDQGAGLVGGLDAAVKWMGDTGLVVATAGDTIEGGIVSIPADPAGGKQLMTSLRSFVQLGGAQMGITIRDEDYNGTTITIVDLGSFQDLAGSMGSGALPIDPSALPTGHVEIAYVATDKLVVIGSSPDFVKHVLDAGAGASLGDDARFQGLVGRVGAANTGVTFVDITAIRALVEGQLSAAPADQKAHYEESIKPFLVPFDAFIAAATVGGDVDQSHLLVTVK